MKTIKIITYSLSLCIVFFVQLGCKKLVDVSPPATSTTGANVYTNDATAAAVLTGIYTGLPQGSLNGGFLSLNLFPSLSADELTLFTLRDPNLSYYHNSLTNTSSAGLDFWSQFYPRIFSCNSAIEGLTASGTLTPAVKQQLLGEAKFLRALFYFYLVNIYGDVPLVTGIDYKVNEVLARSPKDKVYQQIIQDLKDAQNMLSKNYLAADVTSSTSERVRPTYWAATGLLARVYLYYGNLTGDNSNYSNAATQASAVIQNTSLYSLVGLDTVFLKNNNEAIWQLQPTASGRNSLSAREFVIPASGPGINNPVYLSNNLMQSFEAGDNRKSHWVGSVTIGGKTYNYAYKYKVISTTAPVTEYEMVLRLGEQYLIRAEAEANGAPGNAVADLNAIRHRAGLPNYAGATDKTSLLTAIMHERQVEFFTEWGHRWLDLKRTGTVDAVMSVVCPQKGGTWSTNAQLYPIILTELQADHNLKQNPGY